ncbi:MAG: hypothetical protein V1855_00045 [bacterium]
MSIEASIDLRIIHAISGDVISPTKTLEILASSGWSLINQNGYARYLTIGGGDMFDWQSSKMETELFMKILKAKEEEGGLVGVGISWQNTEIDGEILLYCEKEMLEKKINTSMSFCLGDRKMLVDDVRLKITDVNWYLTKLLPAFNQGDTIVEYFTYEEHI